MTGLAPRLPGSQVPWLPGSQAPCFFHLHLRQASSGLLMGPGLYLGFWGFGMSVEGVSDGGVGDWISGERVVGLRKSRDPRHGVGVESRKIPCFQQEFTRSTPIYPKLYVCDTSVRASHVNSKSTRPDTPQPYKLRMLSDDVPDLHGRDRLHAEEPRRPATEAHFSQACPTSCRSSWRIPFETALP